MIRGAKNKILREIPCEDIFDGMTVRVRIPKDIALRRGWTLEYEIQYEDPESPEQQPVTYLPRTRMPAKSAIPVKQPELARLI